MDKFKKNMGLLFRSNRAKSFYWRAGLAFSLLFVGHVTSVLPDLQLGEAVTVFIAYVLNEVTKYLNTEQKKHG